MNMLKLSWAIIVSASMMSLSACVVAGNGNTIKKDPEKSVQARTQLAAEHIRSGDLDSAKRALDQALEVNPRDAIANMMMGILLQQEGSRENLAKADYYYKIAIRHDAENPRIRANYGTYLYQMKRYHEAIAQLRMAGNTLGYEQRFAALENLGRVYLVVGDINNAEIAFNQALQANRGESIISLIELAEIYYLKQKFNEASTAYEQYVRVIGRDSQDARSLWIGLRIARAHGDNLRMQAIGNQMRALFPDSPEYQRYLQLKNSPEVIWK